MVYSSAERVSEPLREPDPRRGTRAAARRRADASCSAPAARCSGARATATSCSTTPTSRAATPRCGRPAARGSCTTSARPTASRSTAGASTGAQSLKRGDVIELGTLASSRRFELEWSRVVRARPGRRRAQVRLPRRAVPVPALDGALGAARTCGAARRPTRRARTTRTPRACTRVRRAVGQRDRAAPAAARGDRGRACAPAPPTISADGALLGRGEQADIQLEDGFASSRHARLVPHGDVIVLEDLGSTNGTYLNGEPLRGPQPLHVGDKIRIGDSEFPSSVDAAAIAEHWHGSDLGRQRQGNEDNFFVRAPLFVVADGMGGAQAGEVASEMAVEVLRRRPAATARRPRRSCRSSRTPTGASTTARASDERSAGHGHDRHGGLRRRGRGDDRPRRRLARLPAARRRADPPHPRPLAGRRAGARAASSPRSRPRRTRSAR